MHIVVAGGCSSFGHSCFGGHGKRADEEFPPAELSAPLASENRAADVELPAFTLLAGGERERSSERMQQPFAEYRVNEVVPLFKQWASSGIVYLMYFLIVWNMNDYLYKPY